MRIIVDKETAQGVAAELIGVGVAFQYAPRPSDIVCSHERGATHTISVDDSRTELLNCVWSIVSERRQRASSTAQVIERVAAKK